MLISAVDELLLEESLLILINGHLIHVEVPLSLELLVVNCHFMFDILEALTQHLLDPRVLPSVLLLVGIGSVVFVFDRFKTS